MSSQIVVDVDLHNIWAKDSDIEAYLDPKWRAYFQQRKNAAAYGKNGRFHPPFIRYPQVAGWSRRPHSTPPTGGAPGSHYETVMEQHILPNAITRAILTWGYGLHPGFLNVNASAPLCRAANDYMVDYWLREPDDRLYGTIGIPVGVPSEAAAEIRRAARHDRFVAILMVVNALGKPFGHPVYHPIYEAAAEVGLPIITHVGHENANKGTLAAGGMPTTKTEYYTAMEQSGMHHFSSLICSDVFEKFKGLKFLFNETGFAWVPWLLWTLDSRYATLKVENPELRRLPSEYFFEHIWMGTQPIAGDTSPALVNKLMATVDGIGNKLCYASDYPHWNAELPDDVRPRLPAAWLDRVMGLNACDFLGWDASKIARAETASSGTVVHA